MQTRPPAASTSMRTGTVRPAGASRSSLRMSRSDDAGGAATSDGASARCGAGMNDDDRGFSPDCNQFATGSPLEVPRVRERRARFFSSAPFGAGGRGAAGFGAGAAATVGVDFGCAFSAAFGAGFGVGFGAGAAAAFGAGAGFATGFGAGLTIALTAFSTVFAAAFTFATGLAAGFFAFAAALAALAARAFGASGFFAAFFVAADFGRAAGRLAARFATAVFFPCTFAIERSPENCGAQYSLLTRYFRDQNSGKVVGNPTDEGAILSLHHHPDQIFGS